MRDIEQFRLDEVFEISRIIKVEVSVKAITPTESSIIPVITKTKSNNFFLYIALKKITTNTKGITRTTICSVAGNRALRAQPTDKSLICQKITK